MLLITTAFAAPVDLSAGYFGHFATHPGVHVGVERGLVEHRAHGVWLGARGAAYTHPGNHIGLMLRPELGYRATADAGPFIEISAGPAYFHRILSGAVYREGADGPRRRLDAGRPGFAPGAGVGLGWDLSSAHPLRLTARAEGWSTTPINRCWRANAAVSFGLTWLGSR